MTSSTPSQKNPSQIRPIPRLFRPPQTSSQKQARIAPKKHLSAPGLIKTVKSAFEKVPLPLGKRNGKEGSSSQTDCLMSGYALFSLKYASLLQFDKDSRPDGPIAQNLATLYCVKKAPSDTYMRECLDEVDPVFLRGAFTKVFASLQRGKELEGYVFYEGHYLISGDGTEYFSSHEVHCPQCCEKHHRNGDVTYYHQMMTAAIVHPDHSAVIPLCPEPIQNADGSKKNDCERNASERLYRHIRREHPHMKIIVTEDALSSNGPHIRLLGELNMNYIIVVKPDGNKSLFEYLNGIKRNECLFADDEFTYKIHFVNKIPLNDTHSDLEVNFLEVWVFDKSGKQVYHNSWVTDIEITEENAYRLYQGGRAKWKIENETFNTLKNQGYHFEHNYGHGKKNLSTVFVLLMMLAFLVDQIQQLCCGLFQAAWRQMGSKVRLWKYMWAHFALSYIKSWEELWNRLAFGWQATAPLDST